MRRGIDKLLVLVLVVAGARQVDACPAEYPNRLLTKGDEAVLRSPVADFLLEVRRIQLPGKPEFQAIISNDDEMAGADLAELRAALARQKTPSADIEPLVSRYRAARDRLRQHARDINEPRLGEVEIPDGLPAEFADYHRGAVAYHQKRYEEARREWAALLDRPAEQRHFRSTWAVFMIGRSWVDQDPTAAVPWFERTRALVRQGFPDSQGLAAASLGWQARAELRRGRYEEAISLYLEQAISGDVRAYVSLLIAVKRLLKEEPVVLERVTRHPLAQQVVTAYIVAQGGPRLWSRGAPPEQFVKTWLEAAEKADVKAMPGAERLAWAAYQADDMEAAKRWLARAPQDSPITKWFKAKLLLHDGRIEPAARLLTEVVRLFPADEIWRDTPADQKWYGFWYRDGLSPRMMVLGEIGVLHVARHEYVEAMDALLRGGFWRDAAYVAEQVLTADELKRYVDGRYPRVTTSAPSTEPAAGPRSSTPGGVAPGVAMRHLLARRLAREKRWQEARGYYPDESREVFDRYTKAYMAGHDRSKSKAYRAEALVEAAWLARRNGSELLGTELEPDWARLVGGSEIGSTASVQAAKAAKVVPSSGDERRRLQQSVGLRKPWRCYRYIAADLAWEAAELMPNESEETAQVLCAAGSWLKARDPKAADRFYKALVRRCGSTPLGKKAAELRWFPVPDD